MLTGIYRAAMLDRLVAMSPCEGVALPKSTAVEVIPPTVEEVHALLAAMPDRYRIAGWLAAGVGLRQGEALGLTVDRIDFLRRQVRIDRQMVTPKRGEPHFGAVKGDCSVRTVPLADTVLEALSGHLAVFPPGPDGLVVTYVDGRPVRRNRFGAMWRQTEARAGLDFRYHDLRHHFASALIAGGVLGQGGAEGAGPWVGQGHARHLRAPLAGLRRPDKASGPGRSRRSRVTGVSGGGPLNVKVQARGPRAGHLANWVGRGATVPGRHG